MSSIKLVKAKECEFTIDFHGNLDKRGSRGYHTEAVFKENESGKWVAEMTIGDMTEQDTPEDAGDRLSAYLLAMSKAVKGKNIKHINMAGMFRSISK